MHPLRPVLARFFLLAGIVGPLSCSRSTGPEPTTAGTTASAPREPIFPNLGSHHRGITTSSADAQRYFDQGLRLVYAFNHDEARRSFQQALELDPKCAMCAWGDAYAVGPNINMPLMPDDAKIAYQLSRKALGLRANASPVERALIDALSVRYSSPPPKNAEQQAINDRAYSDAMRDVTRHFPLDNDVRTLFAESMMDLRPWDFWTKDGVPQPGTVEIVSSLARVLQSDQQHPGANHYFIHALEASPHPETALPSAIRLPELMPGAGHLVHMPAHIYMRIGRYTEAAEANRRAIRVDKDYYAIAKPKGMYAMYTAHNYLFLVAATQMLGRSAEAIGAARDMSPYVSVEMLREMPGYDFQLPLAALALVRFGSWQQVLSEPAPPPDLRTAVAMWHYARGRAFVGLGKMNEAVLEQQALDQLIKDLPDDAKAARNKAKDILYIASNVLTGVRAAKVSKWDEAIAALEDAAKKEDALSYDEPPDWYYPVRHTLGVVLLDSGRPARAQQAYQEDLQHNPENGWSLLGLSLAMRAQKLDAAEVEDRFHRAWSQADVVIDRSDYY